MPTTRHDEIPDDGRMVFSWFYGGWEISNVNLRGAAVMLDQVRCVNRVFPRQHCLSSIRHAAIKNHNFHLAFSVRRTPSCRFGTDAERRGPLTHVSQRHP